MRRNNVPWHRLHLYVIAHMDTLLERTNWGSEYFRNKVTLECGCGSGPDTEVLLTLGARVMAVDIAGVDVAKRNIGLNPNVQFVSLSLIPVIRPH